MKFLVPFIIIFILAGSVAASTIGPHNYKGINLAGGLNANSYPIYGLKYPVNSTDPVIKAISDNINSTVAANKLSAYRNETRMQNAMDAMNESLANQTQEWNMLVEYSDGLANIYNSTGVSIGFVGNNASAIDYAIKNLSSGREVVETVVLKGDFVLESLVTIDDSNTRIKINGRIKLADGANTRCFLISDTSNIIIEGGQIDGNRDGQTSPYCDGIAIQNASTVDIDGVTISECTEDCVYASKFANITVRNCDLSNGNRHGVGAGTGAPDWIPNDNNGILIENNYMHDFTDEPNDFGCGVDVEPADNATVRNNIIERCDYGISFYYVADGDNVTDCVATDNVMRNVISGIKIHNSAITESVYDISDNKISCIDPGSGTANGISVVNIDGAKISGNVVKSARTNNIYVESCRDFSIVDNQALHSMGSGIKLYQSENGVVGYNTVVDNDFIGIFSSVFGAKFENISIVGNNAHSNGVAGIYLEDNNNVLSGHESCTLSLNRCYENPVGIYVWNNADHNFIVNNDVSGNADYAIRISQTNNTIRSNPGYITDSSGSSTGTGAQQTIAHGCQGIPHITITPTNASASYAVWVDSTNFYPTVPDDVAYKWSAQVI